MRRARSRGPVLAQRNNSIGNDSISSLRLGQACPVLLWSEPNYVGNILSVSGDIPDLGFRFSNDMASMKVQGTKIALYDLPNYGGMCENFTGDDSNLDNNPIRQRASSLRFGVDCPPSGVFFADTNYGGDYRVFLPDGTDEFVTLGALKDQASSVYVASGAYLEVENSFVESEFGFWVIRHRCERFTASDPDLRDNWVGNDGIDWVAAKNGPAPLLSMSCLF